MTTGLVLAGGEGRRMGGLDKGLVEFRGRPLAAHAIARLAPQVDRLLISANRHLDRYAAFGHPVLTDLLPGHAGPLAGLQAGLAASDDELLLAVPCDTPLFPTDLAARLEAALHAQGATLAVPRAGGRVHAAFLLCRRHLTADLAAYLATGERRVQGWINRHAPAVVDFPDPAAFANFNTSDALDTP